jgi:hypothetical protein
MILAALASGLTQEQAAMRAGVSAKTVQRRLAEPEFRAELSRVEAEATRQTLNNLNCAAPTAVETLVELMGSGAKESVRLGAARAVLDFTGRYLDRRRSWASSVAFKRCCSVHTMAARLSASVIAPCTTEFAAG